MSDRITTSAITKALRTRFAPPEWATFFEVAQGTGGNGGRGADKGGHTLDGVTYFGRPDV